MSEFGALRLLTATMLGLALMCGACASPTRTLAAPAGPPTPRSQDTTDSVQLEAAQLSDPSAPPTYRPVRRQGKPRPSVRASGAGFARAKPARYPDGVSIAIDRITRAVETGQGPGTFNGRRITTFTVTLTNASDKPINVSEVVVTTRYGSPARLAAPVYDDATAGDFTGSVEPGRSASARYTFAIPADQKQSVVTVVDFDDRHVPAQFSGGTS